MKAHVMLRRRPHLDENIAALSAHHVQEFSRIPDFWENGKGPIDADFHHSEEGGVHLNFDCLAHWMEGQASYTPRFQRLVETDIARDDDYLSLNCAGFSESEYANFCFAALPRLIEVFLPYRARVETNSEVALADWDRGGEEYSRTGRDVDGRDSVYRVWPVSYWDEELCRRSFGLSAEEVVARAEPECEQACVLAGGAFLLVDSKVVSEPADLDVLDARIKARLV